MIIDSYRFLPRSFIPMYESAQPLADEAEPVWAPFEGRLASSSIALLTSGGLFVKGEQEPFDLDRERAEPTWGDPTHRAIPHGVAEGRLGMCHSHVNTADTLADRNVSLPMDVLDDLVADGRVGSTAPSHVSVMGFQAAGLQVWRGETAPAIVELLRAQGSDGVVLAPGCPGCCTNVPVLARRIEAAGIPTVVVTMMPVTAVELMAPRVVGVEFPFGHPFGMPGDRRMQRTVLETAVTVLAGAAGPTRVDVDIEWPQPRGEAYKAWQPSEPSPLVKLMLSQRADQ